MTVTESCGMGLFGGHWGMISGKLGGRRWSALINSPPEG